MKFKNLMIIMFVFIVSCSPKGNEANNTNNTQKDELLVELQDTVKNVTCHHFVNCPDQTTPYITSEDDCKDVFGVLGDLLIMNEVKEVTSSVDDIDQTNFDACIQTMTTMECGEYFDNFAECRQILNGKIADGEWCISDFECESGYCTAGENCPDSGVCAPKVGAGETCKDNTNCEFGLKCNRYTKTCGDTIAQARGSECETDEHCNYGLSCIFANGTGTGSCQPWLEAGYSCDPSDPSLAKCQPGTGCDELLGTCVAVGIVAEGAACDTTHVCDISKRSFCVPYINECTIMPDDGEACASMGLEKFCWLGNYCGDDDICHSQKEIGTACNADEECLSQKCGVRGICSYDPCVDPLESMSF